MINRNQIEQTKTFSEMNPIRRKIYSNSANMKNLIRHCTIALTSGFEHWKAISNPKELEIKIVKDILNIQ